MKRLFIALIVFLALFGKASAQSFNAGVIAGGTFCQVDGDTYAGFHQLGFTVGAYANLPFGRYLSGQMELKYSLLGAHSSHKEVSEYGYLPYSLRMHYVEIPLMLQGNFGIFTIEAGASIDVLMRATEDWSRISATANAGVHFDITKHFGLGARFMYSVAPCRFTGNPGWFYNQYYNKVIQITATYNINSPLR